MSSLYAYRVTLTSYRPLSIGLLQAAIISLGLIVGACNPVHPSRALLQDYRERLANIADIDPSTINAESVRETPFESLPRRSLRTLPLSDLRLGAWDYLQIYECQLSLLVSERNSSLGKVMPASQRLIYESQLIHELYRCINSLAESPKPDVTLIEQLKSALVIKRRELKFVAWNTFFGSQEFERLTSLSVLPLIPEQFENLVVTSQALDELTRIAVQIAEIAKTPENKTELDAELLETQLQTIQSQQSVGRLVQSIFVINEELNTASVILQTALEQNLICPTGNATLRAEYLQNVFVKYYIGKVQPFLSAIQREGRGLLESLHNLHLQYVAIQPKNLVAYFQFLNPEAPQQSIMESFRSSVRTHTLAWQELLASCGLQPSR